MSGTLTPNFRLRKPPFDDIPWDEAVNGNMDIIDAALAQYLTIANFVGVWKNSQTYSINQAVIDAQDSSTWRALVGHTSPPAPTTFAQARAAAPSQWTPAAATVASSNTESNNYKNKIVNGMFAINQRNAPNATVSGQFAADRWFLGRSAGSTATFTKSTIAAAGAGVSFNDEQFAFYMACNFAGSAADNEQIALAQRMENVRELSGKQVSVSFWAWSQTNARLGFNLSQWFGTGGSPSPTVHATGFGQLLTPTPVRYSASFAMPSASGKVFGTDPNSDFTQLAFWLSSEDDTGGFSGGVGVQSGTINITGVQVEIGALPTKLEKPPIDLVVAGCQRMFCLVPVFSLLSATAANQYLVATGTCPVTMRAIPTLTPVSLITIDTNLSAFFVDIPTVGGFRAYATSNTVGSAAFSRIISCSAEFP